MPLEIPIDDPCSFCEYLAGRRRYTILDRDETTATLVTRQQRGRMHVLVIPVEHRPTLLDVQPDEFDGLMRSVVRALRAIAAAVDADGIAVWQKNGTANGQTVPHVHFHVAATLPDGGTAWGPVPTLSLQDADAIAAVLQPHWNAGA